MYGVVVGIVGEIILSEWAARIGRKSLITPGAHLSAVSGVHDSFIISNECIDLVFCNWGRIQLQGEGTGDQHQPSAPVSVLNKNKYCPLCRGESIISAVKWIFS